MQWIYSNLRKDGMVLFEMEDYTKQIEQIKKKGVYRFWEEFPKEDQLIFKTEDVGAGGTSGGAARFRKNKREEK